MRLEAGASFDRYKIEALLGEGGMGQVYRAYDERLQRSVALKVLRVDSSGIPQSGTDGAVRLVREARLAAALDHPNAIAIFDVGEGRVADQPSSFPYIAMELIVGCSLRGYIGAAEVSIAERVRWLTDVARALAAAHRRSLVHRDIKPENVMIRDDGVVKVLDFGIARRTVDVNAATLAAGSGGTLTADGIVVGTPLYMSPEQMRGEKLDGRADQFSWAVMAYELFSGNVPWQKGDGLKVVSQILSLDPPPLRSNAEPLPPLIEATIQRAMAKSPASRFASMDEIVASLDSLGLRTTPSAVPPDFRAPGVSPSALSTKSSLATARPPSLAPRRWRGAIVGGALLLAMAAIAGGWALRVARPSSAGMRPGDASTTVAVAPTPMTPEARRAWEEGMLQLRRSDANGARTLEHVLQLDPDFAPAHLELAITFLETHPNVAREHYRSALEHRLVLIERDQALMDAFGPSFENDPPDLDATRSRLVALTKRMPNDGEIAYWLGQLDVDRLHCADAIPELDRALQLDPESGSAALGKAQCYFVQGDRQGVAAALADCERAVPGAWQCLEVKFADEVKSGRCTDMLADARKAIVTHPDADDPYLYAAQALYAVGSPMSAVTESIAQGRSRSTNIIPIRSRILLDVNLAVLRGDFAEAEKIELAREADKAIAASSEEGIHSIGDWARVEIARESGLAGKAADIASDHVARAEAWTPESAVRIEVAYAFRSRFMGELAHAKRMSRSEYEAARAARIAANAAKDNPLVRGYLWLELYAVPAETTDDAKEALAVLPKYEPIGKTQDYPSGYAIGHVYQLAGRLDDALPRLQEAAGECDAIYFPFENTRAHFALGQVLEAKGDVAGACKSYAVVVSRWGSAKPRSVTGSQAKARMAALRCGTGGPDLPRANP
ncbi:MAG: protein kinase domain-containing protein [Polyangiaceae bacterium]